jgi:hypothetical protein
MAPEYSYPMIGPMPSLWMSPALGATEPILGRRKSDTAQVHLGYK